MAPLARADGPTPEEAAAIAAVLTSLETANPSNDEAAAALPSAWRRAALREGTGRRETLGDPS